jgi:hypothetical protein
MSTSERNTATKRPRETVYQYEVDKITPEFLFPDLIALDLSSKVHEEIRIYAAIYHLSTREIANQIFAKMRNAQQICSLPGSFGYEIFLAKFRNTSALILEFQLREVVIMNCRIIKYINNRIKAEAAEFTKTTEDPETKEVLDKIYGDASQITPFARAIRLCDKDAIENLRWLSTTDYSYKNMCALLDLKSRGLVFPFEFYWEEKFADEIDDKILEVAAKNNYHFLVKFIISRFYTKFTPNVMHKLVFFLLSRKQDKTMTALITEKFRIKFDTREQYFFFKNYFNATQNKEDEFEMIRFLVEILQVNMSSNLAFIIKQGDIILLRYLYQKCHRVFQACHLVNACQTGIYQMIDYVFSKASPEMFDTEFLSGLSRCSEEVQNYVKEKYRYRINNIQDGIRRLHCESRKLGHRVGGK